MRRRAWWLAAALCGVTACATAGVRAGDLTQTMFAPSLDVNLAASTRSPSGFYYRDLTVGTGELAQTGRRAIVRYSGWLTNGSPAEAPSQTPPTVTFRVGAGEVIRGWDRGVVGMREGGRRQLVLPPSVAYGSQMYGSVPPNSVLVFVIELVEVR